MNDSALAAELESLIQGYVEGELTPLECARFKTLIEASPHLVTPILTNLRMDTLIRQAAAQKASADSKILSLPESAHDARAPRSRRSGRFALRVALAACLVVLAASGAIFFALRDSAQPVAPAIGSTKTGSILYEYWAGIPGAPVSALTSHPAFQQAPTGSELLSHFEALSNRGPDYGTRVRGHLHPPVTGNYTFWIASDDASELWLSEDDNPANKKKICFVDSWSRPRDWTGSPSQQSPSVRLQAGRHYYIEALHKQGNGGDCLAVAWQGPGRPQEVIPGEFLSAAQSAP